MPLNKVEQIAALSLLATPDYRELAWLVETTRNLTAKQKVTALSRLVRLALDRNDDEARAELLPLLTDVGKVIRLSKEEPAAATA
jgi:hypothetical protein